MGELNDDCSGFRFFESFVATAHSGGWRLGFLAWSGVLSGLALGSCTSRAHHHSSLWRQGGGLVILVVFIMCARLAGFSGRATRTPPPVDWLVRRWPCGAWRSLAPRGFRSGPVVLQNGYAIVCEGHGQRYPSAGCIRSLRRSGSRLSPGGSCGTTAGHRRSTSSLGLLVVGRMRRLLCFSPASLRLGLVARSVAWKCPATTWRSR